MNTSRQFSKFEHLKWHFLCAALVLGFVFPIPQLRAQPRIAFVMASRNDSIANLRNKIYFIQPDGTHLDSTSIFAGAAASVATADRLTVLAASSDGNSLMIAGHFTYPDFAVPADKDNVDLILRIDSPFSYTSLADLGKIHILAKIGWPQNGQYHPVGVITPDNQNWYATWTATQPGSNEEQIFYHGSFSGTALNSGTTPAIDTINFSTVDSASGSPLQGDFHMTNLTTSPDGKTMVGVLVDNLSNSSQGVVYNAFTWQPHPNSQLTPPMIILALNIALGSFGNASLSQEDYDFGFGIRTEKSGTTADLIMAYGGTSGLGPLEVDNFNYNFPGGRANFTAGGPQIPTSAIADGEYFFDDLGSQPAALQKGNGGDIQFIGYSDSLIFVTHSSALDFDETKSGIYLFELGNSQAQLVYNDPTRQETQPVWVNHAPAAPPKPGYITTSLSALNYGTHPYPGDTTLSVMCYNPSGKSVEVTSTSISGTDQSDFKVVSNTKNASLPLDSLMAGDSIGFKITYTPTKPARTETASFTVEFAGSPDSLRTVSLTGISKDTAKTGAVGESSSIPSAVAVLPNPFSKTAKMVVTAAQSGMLSMRVCDVLGRTISVSPSQMINLGETRTLQIDARQLNLSDGVYYVNIGIGTERISKKLVVIH